MECKFVVGQKVASKVDFVNPEGFFFEGLPTKGSVWTISRMSPHHIYGTPYLEFAERSFVGLNGVPFLFRFDLFEPLSKRPTSIEIFRKMLTNKTMPKELENV